MGLKNDAQAAMAHHVLTREGPLMWDVLCHHVGAVKPGQQERLDWVVLTRGDLFHEVEDDVVGCHGGPPPFVTLPDEEEAIVQRRLLLGPASSIQLRDALAAESCPRHVAEVSLHVAHYGDYLLESGSWSLADRRSATRFVSRHRKAAVVAATPLVRSRGSAATRTPGASELGEVVMTRSGEVYHLDEQCFLLRRGWARVIEDGGRPSGLVSVTAAGARAEGRRPCSKCARD